MPSGNPSRTESKAFCRIRIRDPEPIPHGTEYSSLIESDVPIVVQHTRLDSRQEANALISTMAFADAEALM
jgi:hypothetical protein